MNRRRVAALLRELADELDAEDAPSAVANDVRPQRRAPAPPRQPVAPPSELDRERARNELQRLGYRTRPR